MSPSPNKMEEERQPTGSGLMMFMKNMKETMERTMLSVESNINDKLETRLTNIDDGLLKLNEVVKVNYKKNDEANKLLTGKMRKMEEDIRRLQHRQM